MLTSIIFVVPLLFFCGNSKSNTAYAASALKVLPTDVKTPSADCTFLGIEGKYITQIQEALDLINKIRKEACDEGVVNPSTGKPLTSGDYVPIQWSAGLEYIARIRAAEASLTMDHARTNGKSIWFSSPNGTSSNAEVIAWNWSETMTKGIEQWYGEKNDWVNNTPGAVTGHYTSMIKPGNRYVGLGTFCSNNTRYYNTTAGEFSSSSNDSTRGTSTGNIIQTLEVKNNYISYEINCPDKISSSDKLSITATVSFTDYWGDPITTKGLVLTDDTADKIKWSSSNSNIVVSNGTITIKSCGKANITAELPDGKKVTGSVSAEHSYKSAVTKSATCTENGVKTFTCQNCGDSYTEQIKAMGHKFGAYVVKQQPTTTTEGIEERTCSSCGAKEQRTIAKLSVQSSSTSSSSSSSSSIGSQSSNSSSNSGSQSSTSSSSADSSTNSESSSDTSSSSSPTESTESSMMGSGNDSVPDSSSSNGENNDTETSGSNDSQDGSSNQSMSDSSQSNTDNGDINVPLIVGISAAGVLLVGIAAIIIITVKKKNK